jgi:hypothetical protein
MVLCRTVPALRLILFLILRRARFTSLIQVAAKESRHQGASGHNPACCAASRRTEIVQASRDLPNSCSYRVTNVPFYLAPSGPHHWAASRPPRLVATVKKSVLPPVKTVQDVANPTAAPAIIVSTWPSMVARLSLGRDVSCGSAPQSPPLPGRSVTGRPQNGNDDKFCQARCASTSFFGPSPIQG